MENCRYAIKYKALRKPDCTCELCADKWTLAKSMGHLLQPYQLDLGGFNAQDVAIIQDTLVRALSRALTKLDKEKV
jgi:hypothetical protein